MSVRQLEQELKEKKESKEKKQTSSSTSSGSSAQTSSGKSGVGYGGNAGLDQSARSAIIAKKESQKEMALKVVGLYEMLTKCLSHASLRVNVPPAFYAMLHRSRLVAHLTEYFRTGSVME